jgi:D-sedoheptulose 7-phosphate isomerase
MSKTTETRKEYVDVGAFWKVRIEEQINILNSIAINTTLLEQIHRGAQLICDAFRSDKKLFLCGNGGSAADAQHLATEFVSRFLKERRALDAEALTVNTSSITAIGNDYNFERVFSRQVEAKGRPGDVLIGITTSGNSGNVVEAILAAKAIGMQTIGLTGGDERSRLYEMCDLCIGIPSLSTPRIQEAHILIGHMLCEFVEQALFE